MVKQQLTSVAVVLQNLRVEFYSNFCEGVDDNWGTVSNPYASYHTGNIGNNVFYAGDTTELDLEMPEKDMKLLNSARRNKDDNSWTDIHFKWADSIKNKKGKPYSLLEYVYIMLYAMFKDRYIAEKWKERLGEKIKPLLQEGEGHLDDLYAFLLAMVTCIRFSLSLRTCQGFPWEDGNIYPKMLLVESEL